MRKSRTELTNRALRDLEPEEAQLALSYLVWPDDYPDVRLLNEHINGSTKLPGVTLRGDTNGGPTSEARRARRPGVGLSPLRAKAEVARLVEEGVLLLGTDELPLCEKCNVYAGGQLVYSPKRGMLHQVDPSAYEGRTLCGKLVQEDWLWSVG